MLAVTYQQPQNHQKMRLTTLSFRLIVNVTLSNIIFLMIFAVV